MELTLEIYMTITQYTVNATINVGGTYNASLYTLGSIFPNDTQELIPLVSNSQMLSLSFPISNTGYKVYNTTLTGMYAWDGSNWIETNNYIASTLVANTSTGQTQINISNTNPPNAGQALVAISSTQAAWSNVSGSGSSTPSYNSSFVGTIGDGTTKIINVNHGLGTENILTGVWEASGTMSEVDCSITIIDQNNVAFGFYVAPALNSIKVIIVSSVATNIVPNGLPTQTGFNGDFLTTNGTSASWAPVVIPATLPSQASQAGNYLTTNGTVASWSNPLPAINISTTNKVLTNNGTFASWALALPNQSPYTAGGYYLYTNGTVASWQLTPSWLANPMTTAGDLIIGSTSGAAGRLGIGSVGQSLTVTSSTTLGWTSLIPTISSGVASYFLTNNGTITNWASINQVPTISGGVANYVLSNNGTISQWIYNTNPPSITGQSGNFLTNNGTSMSWSVIRQVPNPVGGDAGYMLATDGSSYFWEAGLTNPMTTAGDLIMGGTSGTAVRLACGSIGQVLTVTGTNTVTWATTSVLSNPMTTYGDIIIGGASGTPITLAVGSVGQILTVYNTGLGHYSVEWVTSTALTNPMTTVGDIIVGGTSGTPTRFAIGSAGTVLTSVSGTPAWTTIIPPISSGTYGEFLTNNGSTVSWGNIPNTLPSQTGFSGDYLTTNGTTASWATIPSGFTNPMTTTGDMISANSGGTAARLAIGTSGQILTVVSGGPSWQTLALPTGLPSQTGYTSGNYYLTTNGTTASWYQLTSQLVPAVSGPTNGYFLGNNGTTYSWMVLPNQLPAISGGTSGDFLTNNGSIASWTPIAVLPTISGGTSGQILSNNGTISQWVSESSVASLGTLPFTFTSGSLAVNASEIDTVSTTCYAFQIFTISVSSPARIRFYGTNATATADLSRLVASPPTGNVGLMAEFVFSSTQLSWICSPVPLIFNNDSSVNQNIYITIQNLGTTTGTINITATILKLE